MKRTWDPEFIIRSYTNEAAATDNADPAGLIEFAAFLPTLFKSLELDSFHVFRSHGTLCIVTRIDRVNALPGAAILLTPNMHASPYIQLKVRYSYVDEAAMETVSVETMSTPQRVIGCFRRYVEMMLHFEQLDGRRPDLIS